MNMLNYLLNIFCNYMMFITLFSQCKLVAIIVDLINFSYAIGHFIDEKIKYLIWLQFVM